MKTSLSDNERDACKRAYWGAKLLKGLGTRREYHEGVSASDSDFLQKIVILVASGKISEHVVADALEAVREAQHPIKNRRGYFHSVLARNLAERKVNLNQLLARTKL